MAGDADFGLAGSRAGRYPWDESKIVRDEFDPDVLATCRNCGTQIDLNDGAILDCPACGAVLRDRSAAEEGEL